MVRVLRELWMDHPRDVVDMNTSAKGAAYENAFKRHCYMQKALFVVRSAASKGPFDLIAVYADTVNGYQLKSGNVSCNAARKAVLKLPHASTCWASVIHKTKDKEFCEH